VKVAEPLNLEFVPIACIRTEYEPGAAAVLHAVISAFPETAK
jgi:hypothetical protein